MLFEILEIAQFKEKIPDTEISKTINTTTKTFYNKKKGITEFTREEMYLIRDIHFPDYTLEELFQKKEDNE